MTDFAYMEQEKKYFEAIELFFKTQYQEHLDDSTKNV